MTEDEVYDEATNIMAELNLTPWDGGVGYNSVGNEWFVMIFEKVKKPALIKWKGAKINYSIGGGFPKAY